MDDSDGHNIESTTTVVVWVKTFFLIGCLLVTGTLNNLVFKILFVVYGKSQAYFVSQGINFLYVVYGGLLLLLLYRRRVLPQALSQTSTPRLSSTQHKHYFAMGFLDACGTFLAALGAAQTPGQMQGLLNQTLIPFTMFFSFMFLGARYRKMVITASLVITLGASLNVWTPKTDIISSLSVVSILLYFSSNIPMALSSVYKEKAFSKKVNVLLLSQWVSVYQFVFGFVLAPLLAFDLPSNLSLVSKQQIIVENFVDGFICSTVEQPYRCRENNAGLLLLSYCAINFIYNLLGLLLLKNASALFNCLATALLLPFTTLVFSMPFIGKYREPFSSQTVLSLILVLLGIILYQYATRAHPPLIEEPIPSTLGERMTFTKYELMVDEVKSPSPRSCQCWPAPLLEAPTSSTQLSFQERIITLPYGTSICAGEPDVESTVRHSHDF